MKGTFLARPAAWDLGYAGTGTEQIAVQFVLLEGEYEGRAYTWYGFFTDETTDRTLESLKHCGWDGVDLFKLDGMGSQDVEIVLDEEEDNQGRPRVRVKWVNALGSGGPALKHRMDDAQKRDFAARMRSRVAAFNQKQGAPRNTGNPNASRNAGGPRSTQRAAAASQPQDDDIPF